jgi:ribosomal protein L11 methyltransferase
VSDGVDHDAGSEPRFPFLAVDVPESRAEELGHELMLMGASGVDLRDDTTMVRGPGGGQVRLVASVATKQLAEALRRQVLESEPSLHCEVGELVGDGWRDAYKEHFKPFALTASLVVAPPWESYDAKPGESVLCLDPGRAFGTGLHDTTSLVAEVLDGMRDRLQGKPMLDVGTGSGILALSALTLGAASAVAVDNDPDVIEVVAQNAERCGLGGRIEASTTPIEDVPGCFDVVVANIRSTVLVPMASALVARVASGGCLVLSGILVSEADEVLATYLDHGVTHVATTRRGQGPEGWVAIELAKA